MAGAGDDLRVFFFPFVSPGHMIPMLDIARLFARRPGVSATVITTPGNERLVRPTLDYSAASGHPIGLLLLPFPDSASHLIPGGRENLSFLPSSSFGDLYVATFALRQPLHHLLLSHRPDCLISDAVFSYTSDIALELGIPRLVFHGPGIFPLCVADSLERHQPHLSVSTDSDPFVVDGLPDRITLTRYEVPEVFSIPEMVQMRRLAEKKSYGIVINSFFELEPAYAELYRSEPGRRAWYIGPVSLCETNAADMARRGGGADVTVVPCSWLTWLDSQPPRSVLYVCFGSICEFPADQIEEIAAGLEKSGRPFLWVLRDITGSAKEGFLLDDFEKRVQGKGVVLKEWAPQVLILNHPAVGGFMTHCGWNSTLEAVSAGVAMATWPLSYEQFINQRFVVEVARVGVRVKVNRVVEDEKVLIKGKRGETGREEVKEAVEAVMGDGKESVEMRRRAAELREKARRAVAEGGSSYEDLSRLIEELKHCKKSNDGPNALSACVD